MASRSLGTLTLDLVAKTSQFTAGMTAAERTAKQRLDNIQRYAKQAGAVLGTALAAGATLAVNALRQSINNMDELSKASQRVGLPVEQFSALTYAGKLADVSIGDLQSSLGKLVKSQAEALKTTSQQAKVFGALGIAVTDATGKLRGADEVLADFADAFKRQEGSPEIIAAGLQIFGRSFQNLIPLIKDGSQGLRDAADEAAAFGQIISTETAQQAEAFNDNLTRMQSLASGLANAVAAELLPDLQRLTDEWVNSAKEGDGLTKTAVEIADAIRAVAGFFQQGADKGAVFRRELTAVADGLRDARGAARDMADAVFSLDAGAYSKAVGAYKDAGKGIASALFNGVDEAANEANVPNLFAGVTSKVTGTVADRQIVEQMRAARAEAERLRKMAFGDAPKPTRSGGGGAKTARKSDEEVEAERLIASYEGLIESLKERTALIGAEGEAAKVSYDIQFGGLSKLTEAQKGLALAAAEKFDADFKANQETEKAIALAEREVEQRERAIENTDRLLEDMQFELDIMGLSNVAREKAIFLRHLEADATDEQRAAASALFDEIERGYEMKDFMDDFKDGLSDAFVDFATGAKSAKEAFGDFMDDLFARALKFTTDKAIDALFNSFSGDGKQQGGGGGLAALFGSFFGGARANGGPVSPSKGYLVGERGPEWFRPNTAGSIIPNRQTMGGAGVVQNIAINYRAPYDARTESQKNQKLASLTSEAARRNN